MLAEPGPAGRRLRRTSPPGPACARSRSARRPSARCASASSAPPSPKVARLVLDLSREGALPHHRRHRRRADRLRRGRRARPRRPRPARGAAARAEPAPVEPAPVEPAPVAATAARPVALEPLALPALPEPQAPAGRRRPPPRSRAPSAPPAGRPATSGRRSASTSRTATCRTSSGSSRTSPGLNVVVNPGVSGKVTLKLNEVPWGRALELILKTNGLGCVLEDNVIRIAQARATCRRKRRTGASSQEEKALAGRADGLHEADLLREGRRRSQTVLTKAGALCRRAARSTSTPAPTR